MRKKQSVTIIELIIALCIFAVMFLAFATIQLYSRFHFLTGKRRAVVQNEVTLVLEHMAKYIGGAIGDKDNFPVVSTTIRGNNGIAIRVDSDRNGKRDPNDGQIAYTYAASSYKILFYTDTTNSDTEETLTAGKIRGDFSNDPTQETFVSYDPARNWLETRITGRWNPAVDSSRDNPQVQMRSRIKMPAVSVN
jgi:hypothetical protein